ncbi:hypothetical protein KPH14_012864, partial [Odynerus spinipes]
KVPADRKVAYLLHFIGPKSFDVICDKIAPKDPYTETYQALTTNLSDFYAPAPLEIAENFRFYQRKQRDGENVQQFVAALQKLSINCNFGDYQQKALRNQLVFGIQSRRIQARLLETKDLTFGKAVETAAAMELTDQDVTQLQAGQAPVEYLHYEVCLTAIP